MIFKCLAQIHLNLTTVGFLFFFGKKNVLVCEVDQFLGVEFNELSHAVTLHMAKWK